MPQKLNQVSSSKYRSYDKDQLTACAQGKLGGAKLPLPPMLMLDRITSISGASCTNKGEAIAELDISPELWFFKAHFMGDPVMPGSLVEEGLRQLTGFYAGWIGGRGKGRFKGCDRVKFYSAVTPKDRMITYSIDVKKVFKQNSHLMLVVANGNVNTNSGRVCSADNIKVVVSTLL